jgi:membrane-associated protein
MDIALLLQSGWLLPALALLVALDGPFPVLPSEPLLMTASAVAASQSARQCTNGTLVR